MNSFHSPLARLSMCVVLATIGCGVTPSEDHVDVVADPITVVTNLALNRPATQSSVGWNGVPSRAVDGNTDGNFFDNSVTHTNYEHQPYWQVDLGTSNFIDTLELWNRTDCCSDRLDSSFIFYKDTPFVARLASDLLNEDGVTFQILTVPQSNPVALKPQRRARYVRIQLAGDGYLSLAEVRALTGATTNLGPPKIATHTSWVPTGIVTEDQALAAVDVQGVVHAFFRGQDGLLHDAAHVDGALNTAVPGSPVLATSGVAAAFDAASGKVFVAVPTTPYGVRIVEGTASGGTIANWTWTVWQGLNFWGNTSGTPAIATGCGRVFLAVHMSESVIGTSRPVGGGAWMDGSVIAASPMPPAIAVNGRGDVAEAIVDYNGKVSVRTFSCQNAAWADQVTLNAAAGSAGRVSADHRVGLAAIGNRFAVAIVDANHNPWVMVQSAGSISAPAWPADYEWPNASLHAIGPVKEAPTLFTYRGLLIMAARSVDNAMHYSIRNPNVSAYRNGDSQMWTTGPSVVGNYGVGAVPPVLVETGRDDRWTAGDGWAKNVPTELVVLTKGIGDRQIYAADFARFAMIDVMTNLYGIRINHFAPVNQLQNASDHLVAFLMSPSAFWASQARPLPCGNLGVQIFITPGSGENTQEDCGGNAPDMTLNGVQADPSWLWQEWGHMVSWGSQLAARSDFIALFQDPQPRRCSTVVDCAGPSGTPESFGYCGPVLPDSAAEALLGAGTNICWTSQARTRMQGYVLDYDLDGSGGTDHSQHAFLDVATYYRWYGDQLRAWVAEDTLQGSDLLARKYNFIRTFFYAGIEYNGTTAVSANAATSDESLGAFAAPLR